MGYLTNRLHSLARGTAEQRKAAEVAETAFEDAANVGPEWIAERYDLPADAPRGYLAHVFALDHYPAAYADIAAQFAEVGLLRFEAMEQSDDLLVFQAMRELCGELGPWGMALGTSAMTIAEDLADQNPDHDRASLMAGALAGFEDNLQAAHKLIESGQPG